MINFATSCKKFRPFNKHARKEGINPKQMRNGWNKVLILEKKSKYRRPACISTYIVQAVIAHGKFCRSDLTQVSRRAPKPALNQGTTVAGASCCCHIPTFVPNSFCKKLCFE